MSSYVILFYEGIHPKVVGHVHFFPEFWDKTDSEIILCP